jgi:uncharacterized caspase-like protein
MASRHALLIATETYTDPSLRRLTAPGGDARALAEVLSDPSIAGFEVTTLIDQPHHVVGEAIGEFYRGRRRDELTLLYFTGHGVKDDDGSLYLAMANTRRDSLMFTALAAELVDRAMAGCPSRQKVLVLDCCYSGAFPAGRLAKAGTDVHTLERFQGRGRAVLTASDATQYSFEGDAVVGSAARSVFTRHLVAGLRDGSADLDGDGDVTVDELYSYVHERVVAEMPRQRPKHQSDVEGRIVLARNPRWELPEYLRHGLASPIASDRMTALEGLQRLHRVGNETVRAETAAQIRRLVDDDSRTVSAAAAAWVAQRESTTGPVEAPAPVLVGEVGKPGGPGLVEVPASVGEVERPGGPGLVEVPASVGEVGRPGGPGLVEAPASVGEVGRPGGPGPVEAAASMDAVEKPGGPGPVEAAAAEIPEPDARAPEPEVEAEPERREIPEVDPGAGGPGSRAATAAIADEPEPSAKKVLSRRAKIWLAVAVLVVIAATVLLVVLLSTSGGSSGSSDSGPGFSSRK